MVLRSDLATIEPAKLSLMPVGFESALRPQEMADLIRWLRAPEEVKKQSTSEDVP
ncbi:MAG: hypothetical protein M9920_10805 [Verrucomicrobiae bacterium]|nr:hypothetical protein [Verrucomicrobiae bacterium]